MKGFGKKEFILVRRRWEDLNRFRRRGLSIRILFFSELIRNQFEEPKTLESPIFGETGEECRPARTVGP